ncbi:HEAT repeat domain-containing protein, partial [bacterium]|nr:HEAT repeat domain-containing protein [bacterium]
MNDPGNRPTESPSKLLYFILCACVAALVATSIRGCIKLRRPPSPAAQQPSAQPRPQPKPQPARPAAPTQKPAAPEPVVSNAIPAENRDDDETGMQGVVLPPDSPVPDDDYGVYISAALQALRKNLSEEEKLNAMAQVEMIGHPMVMPVVMEALDDDSIEVRQSAIESIRVLDDPCVIPAVVKALDDKDTVIRADA